MRRLWCSAILVAAAIGSLVAGTAAAQEHPIIWSLAGTPTTAKQGVPFSVTLRAQIPAPWHVYSMTQPAGGGPVAMTIGLPSEGEFLLAGKIVAPPPEIAPDKSFPDLVTETYLDSATFVVPVVARSAGPRVLSVDVGYQTCTDTYCLAPRTDTLTLAVAVAPGSAVTSLPAARHPKLPGGAPSTSFLLFLWAAAVMGALSLLTPCVFPMIPITVSYFTRAKESQRGTPARNALIYAGGIIATFTLLGMGIATLADAGGLNRFAANPWVNLAVTAIFIAFAINLFGGYQIALPATLLTRLDAATRRTGGSETAGIVLMGFTFTLTSFTCTVPFVGTLLVMAAQGNWQWSLFGLLIFSAVFALPFFFLALMPSAVAKLPRAGSWLTGVKAVMGFVELAMAMKFLSNADMVWRWGVFSRNVVLSVWIAIAVATALYLLGVLHRPSTAPRAPIRPAAWSAAAFSLAIAVFLGLGLRGTRLGELESFLPPPEGIVTRGTTSVVGELPWIVNDYQAALTKARAEHKAVIVDFTGYTCTNCRWMEANMFPRPAVKAQLGGMIRVRLYTDGQGELYRVQQRMELERFGTVALPYYAVVDSEGTVQAQFLGMTRSTEEFLQFLSTQRM